jgi:2-polyprenyl-6-methoxyphenol hydroxylase-like FAD-dependent oxidoreductase
MLNHEMADVLIIGGGLAGATAAAVLGNQGIRVTLLDARDPYPDCFKAEKIEEEQADLFRKFGLFDALLPATGCIRTVFNAQRGKILYGRKLEQYGIHYHDMVNIIRRRLPSSVDFKIGRAESISTGPQIQRVGLNGGEELTARLVVVASGAGAQLCARLGIQRKMIRQQHSLTFGFDIERLDGEMFPFESVSYYPLSLSARIGYLTLFVIGRSMRANLFTFRTTNDGWVRQFVRDPEKQLEEVLPGLTKTIGPFRVTSRVESASINLYTTEGGRHPGLVLIGDAFQSVCPSTGTGLSRVLTDVDVLAEFTSNWLATPEMDLDKINQFYEHPRKIATDALALSKAEYSRTVSTVMGRQRIVHQALLFLNGYGLMKPPELS